MSPPTSAAPTWSSEDRLEPIECTFENTRLNTLMTLDKDWINPFEGDRYGLQISGTGNGNGVSTAPAVLDTPVAAPARPACRCTPASRSR
ncbi:MAG: hypothetical protein R2697_18555 [Ilumatobacteraceae bacterium]